MGAEENEDFGASVSKPSPCSRCALYLGRSCCQVEPHEALATLTHADLERLTLATGLPAPRLCDVEVFSHDEARTYEARRPLYDGYFRQGPFRLTLKQRAGACVLFEPEKGCRLDISARPTACRLYPLEWWPGDALGLQVERHGSVAEARVQGPGSACLAVEEAPDFPALCASLGMRPEDAVALARRLRDEVKSHAQEPLPRWVTRR